MNYLSAESRYQRDPLFKQVVDAMESHIEALLLTPTELREAAMLACIKFELRHPRPMVFGPLRDRAEQIASGSYEPPEPWRKSP
jgi:hypothetical protein